MTVTEPVPNVGPPYDPPPKQYIGPLESVVRNPVATLVPVVLLVAIALLVGLSRAPTYTAESRISVGRADVPAFTLQNVVAGNQALAAGYARAIEARGVVRAAGRRVELGPATARGRLTASPIPGSTLIRVEAKGPSDQAAIKLSNAGSRALIAYVEKLQLRAQTTGILGKFRAAQATTDKRRARVGSLLRRGIKGSALQQARLDLLTAQLRSQRLSTIYNSTFDGPSPTSPLQLLAPADSATSDFSSVLERLLLVALAAGLAIGVGLALALANGRRRRWT